MAVRIERFPTIKTIIGLAVSITVTLMRRNFLALCMILLILQVFVNKAENTMAIPNATSHTTELQAEEFPSTVAIAKSTAIGTIEEANMMTPTQINTRN